jgi:hypothetical protein
VQGIAYGIVGQIWYLNCLLIAVPKFAADP